MQMEFELKPTDILLLKLLSCVLMAVLTLNLFVLPGLETHSDLAAQRDEMELEKQQVEDAIASIPAVKVKIADQQKSLIEMSADYYPQMENNDIDELVTGIALAHQLFPAALNIEDSVPGIPAAYGNVAAAESAPTEVEQMQEEVEGKDNSTDTASSSVKKLIADPYVSDIQYINTTQASLTLQGTEEQLRAFLDDIAKHYPAIQVRSMQATKQTYVNTDLKAVQQLDISCTLAIYTCGDKNHEEVTTDENEP